MFLNAHNRTIRLWWLSIKVL